MLKLSVSLSFACKQRQCPLRKFLSQVLLYFCYPQSTISTPETMEIAFFAVKLNNSTTFPTLNFCVLVVLKDTKSQVCYPSFNCTYSIFAVYIFPISVSHTFSVRGKTALWSLQFNL